MEIHQADGAKRCRLLLVFASVDFDLRDVLDEAIHEATAAIADMTNQFTATSPQVLLAESKKQTVAGLIGNALFALTWIYDMLAENWGANQLISGRRFAQEEDLTQIDNLYKQTVSTLSAPTEAVQWWRTCMLSTCEAISITLGRLSGRFGSFRWDDHGFNPESEAAEFVQALEFIEAIAAFFGVTLSECMKVNQAAENKRYPEGWRAAVTAE